MGDKESQALFVWCPGAVGAKGWRGLGGGAGCCPRPQNTASTPPGESRHGARRHLEEGAQRVECAVAQWAMYLVCIRRRTSLGPGYSSIVWRYRLGSSKPATTSSLTVSHPTVEVSCTYPMVLRFACAIAFRQRSRGRPCTLYIPGSARWWPPQAYMLPSAGTWE